MSQECDIFMEKISDCLDQDKGLSPDLDSHVKSCPQCRDFSLMWSSDQTSLASIASIPDQTNPPSGIADSVIQERAQPRKNRKVRSLGLWGSVAAAAAIMAGVFFWNSDDKPEVAIHKPAPTQAPEVPDNPAFKISEIDTKALEIKVRKFTELGERALRQKGQTYANAVKGIRYLAVNFSDL